MPNLTLAPPPGEEPTLEHLAANGAADPLDRLRLVVEALERKYPRRRPPRPQLTLAKGGRDDG
jgi:hypothetical protein